MPINCLIKFLINFWTVMFQKSIHGQFVNNSRTFMFQKNGPFAFHLLSLPLFSSLRLFVSLSLCLFFFLSLPLLSSLFLSLPLLLSFFNVHPAQPANFLKTKGLRKRHFWLQIFESREAAKTQNVRCKIRPIFCPLPRRPYMLRRETLHYVGFHVGFADPILHT